MHFQEYDLSGLRYLICYPKDFREDGSFPVLFFLHGAGTRGRDMNNLIHNNFFEEVQHHRDFPFVVVAPLCTENTWFELWERLMALVKQTAHLPWADSSRFYVMGASMGGYGTWQLAMSIPEYFAAIVPICGGGMYWNAGRLQHVPAWAFHGGKDTSIPMEESQKMVDSVNANGGHAMLTIYPENGHNAWTDTYSNPEVFAWLLSHRSANAAAPEDEYHSVREHG